MSLDLSYIDQLYVTIGYGEKAIVYEPSHFQTLRAELEWQLEELLQKQL